MGLLNFHIVDLPLFPRTPTPHPPKVEDGLNELRDKAGNRLEDQLLPLEPGSIAFVKVVALMDNQPLRDSEVQLPKGNLLLKIILSDGKVHQAKLKGIKKQGHHYEKELNAKGTPWMDGVGQVTQCQIGPSSTFTYKYTARPSGTFWYHSHSGAQRTDGLYGALIVKENKKRLKQIQTELNINFKDKPHRHTLTLLDWQLEASFDLFTQAQGHLGFYPDKPLGEVPTPDDPKYKGTRSFDNGGTGPIPYFSGIINGKGRHDDVKYKKTRLRIFTVRSGETYRFRLIGAQGLYSYSFSIDGHKLTVVGTDGYWIEPQIEVDYIMIHPGERYDFLLSATETTLKDYWIRAETMEID
ncbi:Laccase-5 [Stylophora pistillata]|uniref:Laccase-5 n=1 Tax=Stylophora pistillata TaxID=50429 RepID=A0A2B4RHA2_STYPI|nr:Laccase-5 [Stylophora pistillata]